MKINTKTDFWKEKKIKVWGQRYEKLSLMFIIFSIINIANAMVREQWTMTVVNAIPLTINLIIQRSYAKKSKKRK